MTNPALGALLPFLLGWAALRGRGENRAGWQRAGLGGWTRDFVLRAVDDSELRSVSQTHSGAVEFAV